MKNAPYVMLLLSAMLLCFSSLYHPKDPLVDLGTIQDMAVIRDESGKLWIALELESGLIAIDRDEATELCKNDKLWNDAFMNKKTPLLEDDGHITISNSNIKVAFVIPKILKRRTAAPIKYRI